MSFILKKKPKQTNKKTDILASFSPQTVFFPIFDIALFKLPGRMVIFCPVAKLKFLSRIHQAEQM